MWHQTVSIINFAHIGLWHQQQSLRVLFIGEGRPEVHTLALMKIFLGCYFPLPKIGAL